MQASFVAILEDKQKFHSLLRQSKILLFHTSELRWSSFCNCVTPSAISKTNNIRELCTYIHLSIVFLNRILRLSEKMNFSSPFHFKRQIVPLMGITSMRRNKSKIWGSVHICWIVTEQLCGQSMFDAIQKISCIGLKRYSYKTVCNKLSK